MAHIMKFQVIKFNEPDSARLWVTGNLNLKLGLLETDLEWLSSADAPSLAGSSPGPRDLADRASGTLVPHDIIWYFKI